MDILRFARTAAAALLALAFTTPAFATTTAYAPDPPPATVEMYATWVAAMPGRSADVQAFEEFLAAQGVAGIFPTYEILRSESLWSECGGEPFVLAARAQWPHVVGTLRFIRDQVVPLTGELEIVSGYRNPALNTCSGGRSASAHMAFWALDLEPVAHITRDEMVASLCPVYAARGRAARIGLGFYDDTRFHIDARSFRTWGSDGRGASSPCNGVNA
jgi:Peptidase M15